MNNPQNVVVAMSGGVDSSVAAALLVRQGYRVTGMMLRLWSETGQEESNRCCTPDAMAQARRVSARLGIPFYAIDAKDTFRSKVVQYFLDGYEKGITPNPCLVCNRHIRWGFLMQHAREFGADFLATGHYARLRSTETGQQELLTGIDANKDQSYVLSGLSQAQLSRSMFPVGAYQKSEIREIARETGLSVAERADSQDLCFVGDRNIRRFLSEHAPQVQQPGPIRTRNGETLGQHHGLAFYTIGQRKGLGVAAPEPLYVLEKDITQNTLIVGHAEELGRSSLTADSVNWVSGAAPDKPFRAQIKIRYKAEYAWGELSPVGEDRFRVEFDQPLRDITPGQMVVVYLGEVCLGGGIIAA